MTPGDALDHIRDRFMPKDGDDRQALDVLDAAVTLAVMQEHLADALHIDPRTDDSMRHIKHYLKQIPLALQRMKEQQ